MPTAADLCGAEAQACLRTGLALAERGMLAEAAASFRRAALLKPDDADARNYLGNMLYLQRQYQEAILQYREVLRLQPQSAEAHYNLANVFKQLRRADEAIHYYREALRLRPDLPEAHNNLGISLKRQGRLDEAMRCYEQAVRLRPNFPDAFVNIGNVHGERGLHDQAMLCYEQALRLNPHHADTHFNRATLWLTLGDWARGWREYEWRWRTNECAAYTFHQPRWDGSALNGRTLLVATEQGMGDTLQFIRYVPVLRRLGNRVIVQCQPPLRGLLAASLGADSVAAQGEPLPHFDTYIPLLTLPAIFGTTVSNLPAQVPYLKVDGGLVSNWASVLDSLRPKGSDRPSLRIGIAWQGNPDHLGDHQRSFPLQHFAPLAHVPGVDLISLQKGFGTDQIPTVQSQFPVLDLESRLGPDSESLMSIAAIMKNLDLVISCDTAIAHVAAALGVRVWVPLPKAPDWRWMLDREDSPWYPTLRLYRQTIYGQWEHVFLRMAEDLKKLAAEQTTTAETHGNQGLACAEAGKLHEAETHFRQALKLNPDYAKVHNNFGNTLVQLGRRGEAQFHYREALRLRPDYPQAHSNLGNLLNLEGYPEDAETHCRTALRSASDFVQAYHNLGVALLIQGKLDQALEQFEQVLRCRPDAPEAHLSRALVWMLQGDYERGLAGYEWRWKQPGAPNRNLSQPLWDGSNLDGRTILLYAEQGLGDTIQFIRYAALVKNRGGTVIVECQPALREILTSPRH